MTLLRDEFSNCRTAIAKDAWKCGTVERQNGLTFVFSKLPYETPDCQIATWKVPRREEIDDGETGDLFRDFKSRGELQKILPPKP